MAPSDPPLTEDALLNGRVVLLQPERGFRAGLDSVLLAAAASAPEVAARVLEIGCGAGGALLAAAALHPRWRFVGVEREAFAADLARRNAAANGADKRVSIIEADALADPGLDLGESFDAALCNPPFNARGHAPDETRAHAHLTEYPIDAWIKAIVNRLRGGAHLTLIHRAEALGSILSALDGRLGGARVIPVHPFADQPAHRVLVRATKGSRAGLTLLPGLALHQEGAKHTPQAEAILRGRVLINWD
jgi:tRNA1(Val) A37 N6-methylase TrmN6